MRNRTIIALAALLLAAGAAQVQASLWPPVEFKVREGAVKAEAGQPLTVHVEIASTLPVTVANFRVEGEGWQTLALDAPAAEKLAGPAPTVVTFTILPNDPDRPVELVMEIDGKTWRQMFDFSPRHYDIVTRPQPEVAVPRTGPDRPAAALPRVAPPVKEEIGRRDGDQPEPDETGGAEKRTIRVYGRFVYQRSDGTTIGADGVHVQVYDEDTFWDDLLADGVTDAYGYYDFTINTDDAGETDPDLYVRFETSNSKVTVKDASSGNVYTWQSATNDNFSGSEWNRGWTQPSDEAQHPALHILTDLVRNWRWDLGQGYDNPHVDGIWPDGTSGAWYWNDAIHISTGRQWREDTHAHEYGHHWMDNWSVIPPFDYCNGICDNSPTDCGHCIWCQEDAGSAYSEGWANWCADVKTRSYAGTYGIASQFFRSQEDLATCFVTGGYDDPTITEGFFGALLRDIEDSDQDSHGVYGTWSDALALGYNEIYTTVDNDNPVSPMDFLSRFKARYPTTKEDLWETAKNCGYEIDTAAPAAPTNLTSPSHSTSGDSPDPTIDFTWTRATDDASGVAGYSIFVSTFAPVPPAYIHDIDDVTSYTTDPLPPGTYYFNIRTLDRAGNWSSDYASYGPIVIRAAEPADLVFYQAPNWDYPLVPRDATGGTYSETRVTPTLAGDGPNTYWNMRGQNAGESSTSVGFQARVYLDGAYMWWASWGPIGAGGGFYGVDMGPFYVHGGRHTLTAKVDATDVISETDETNNWTGRQYIWTTNTLTPNSRLVRYGAPDRTAGWAEADVASWFNCDGLSFTSSGWWNAVYVYATDLAEDFDCRLHVHSTGSEDGFASNVGYSSYGAGLLDAVFVNRNTQGSQTWDVGTLNVTGGSSTYAVEHVTSTTFGFGDSLTFTFDTDELLNLHEVYVATADTGDVSIVVDVPEGDSPVHVLLFDKDFTTGDPYDAVASTVAPAGGRGRIDTYLAPNGFYCVAVYRDPVDGTGTSSYTLEVQRTPPDFLPYFAAGWHAPLVPRPADDGTPSSVALPDTLHGNVASTYLNLAVRNESPTGAPSLHGRVYLDDVYWVSLGWGNFPGGANSLFNWSQQLTVRGGRHTMVLKLDPLQEIEEIYEDNNEYGEQYLWSPLEIASGASVTRSHPPARTGGWTAVNSGEPLWFNCDGLRTPHASWWQAIAVIPQDADTDVDIRLHEPLSGTKTGFASYLAYSGWGPGHSDYVLVNFNLTGDSPYDAGVLSLAGSAGYTAQSTPSLYNGVAGGNYGPFTLLSGSLLDLHEFYFTAGYYTIALRNLSGSVDWGLTLHPADEAFQSKSTAVPGGQAWLQGPGENEYLTLEIPANGYYCLAVWKKGVDDVPLEGSYQIHIGSGMTDADDLPGAAVTALTGVHPNPFNPQTTIAYHLATETAVDLAIYDLRGARVRTLVTGRQATGAHQAAWDGTDDAGRRVPSGTYMVRLRAGGTRDLRKVMLVK